MTAAGVDLAPVAGPPAHGWYRDAISCLHSTIGTLARLAGEDPLEVCGLAWAFFHIPGDVRPEEFYWPCPASDDLVASVAPHAAVSSSWHTASGPDPLAGPEAALASGSHVIAAVDNYYLPFRPAYHDVHAAHLLVVLGLDRERERVRVSDAMPPAYCGDLAAEDFLRSWHSPNPRDEQDVFFSDARIGGRWLEVRLEVPQPSLTPARMARVLAGNAARFRSQARAGAGLVGLAEYTAGLLDDASSGDGRALEALYVFGWAMQAQAALHGELLRERGSAWGVPLLREAGRAVERVAHAWTGPRVTGAHHASRPRDCAGDLSRQTARLRRAYEEAVAAVEAAAADLPRQAVEEEGA